MLLRLLTGCAAIFFGIANLRDVIPLAPAVLQVIGAGTGIFILVGLWTPAAGALLSIVKLWIAFARYSSHSGDVWIPIMQAVLGAALAMIGPGAWSVDAKLFGRKHIDL